MQPSSKSVRFLFCTQSAKYYNILTIHIHAYDWKNVEHDNIWKVLWIWYYWNMLAHFRSKSFSKEKWYIVIVFLCIASLYPSSLLCLIKLEWAWPNCCPQKHHHCPIAVIKGEWAAWAQAGSKLSLTRLLPSSNSSDNFLSGVQIAKYLARKLESIIKNIYI